VTLDARGNISYCSVQSPILGPALDGSVWEVFRRGLPERRRILREGLEETFTINRLGLSPRLRRCLATTNVIESLLSGVGRRTGWVTRWRDGAMVLRWAGAAALETEKRFRKIIGHRDLWMLKAALDEGELRSETPETQLDKELVAA
jgi:transposase-like protein